RRGHREQGFAVDLQPINAVFGLDVDHLAVGITENAPNRRRNHAMPVRISKDHHAPTHDRIGNQIAGVQPTRTSGWISLVAKFSGCDADHWPPARQFQLYDRVSAPSRPFCPTALYLPTDAARRTRRRPVPATPRKWPRATCGCDPPR